MVILNIIIIIIHLIIIIIIHLTIIIIHLIIIVSPYCKAAKEALTTAGKKFEYFVVDDEQHSELIKLTGI